MGQFTKLEMSNQKCSWLLCCLQLILILNLSLAIEVLSANDTNKRLTIDTTVIKGWTEISQKWPINEQEYYISVAKEYSFIQVLLPEQLDYDVYVELEYYYNFAKVRPMVQAVPCKTQIDIVNEHKYTLQGVWQKHTMRVKKTDCALRNELKYNIILHDENDVFAWRKMKVTSIKDPSGPLVTDSPSEPEVTEAPFIVPAVFENPPNENEIDDMILDRDPVIVETSTLNGQPSTESPTQAPSIEDTSNESIPEPKPTVDSSSETSEPRVYETSTWPAETSEPATTLAPSELPSTGKPIIPIVEETSSETTNPDVSTTELYSNMLSTTGSPSFLDDDNSRHSTERPEFQPPDVSDYEHEAQPKSSPSKKGKSSAPYVYERSKSLKEIYGNDWGSQGHLKGKIKRDTINGGRQLLDMTCKPSLCDLSTFRLKNFLPLFRGLPELSEEMKIEFGKKSNKNENEPKSFYLLSTESKPLNFELESTTDFTLVDTCLDFFIFKEPSTEVKLLIEDNTATTKYKLLETLTGTNDADDKTDGLWVPFKRCLTDYMPNLKSESATKNDLRLRLESAKSNINKQLAVFGDRESSFYLKKLFPVPEFIPNLNHFHDKIKEHPLETKSFVDVESLKNYWIFSNDEEGKLKFDFVQDQAGANKNSKQLMRISNINPNQKSFDLTSRWLKIEDVETLENKIKFEYNAVKPDWLDTFAFDYQGLNEKWLEVYKTTTSPGILNSAESSIETTQTLGNAQLGNSHMQGLTNDEFRLRIRHSIKPEFASRGQPLELDMAILAFGDVCADEQFCQNGGACQPTGSAKGECKCPAGFSGDHCEKASYCDMRYLDDSMTGTELCAKIGAVCNPDQPDIPAFRCIWPNDTYYKCQALEQHANNSNGVAGQAEPSTEDIVEMLKEKSRNLYQWIIILAVFMIAMLLFLVVIVVNIVNRLMKTKRQLKESQSEVYELGRRSQGPAAPQPAAGFGRFQRAQHQRPTTSAIAYNNQAFDAA